MSFEYLHLYKHFVHPRFGFLNARIQTWFTAGFRNRDLRAHLHGSLDTLAPAVRHRLTARVSRQLRLLRAHGLVRKIPKTHRYQLTERGRLLAAAIRATRDANLKQLLAAA